MKYASKTLRNLKECESEYPKVDFSAVTSSMVCAASTMNMTYGCHVSSSESNIVKKDAALLLVVTNYWFIAKPVVPSFKISDVSNSGNLIFSIGYFKKADS